MTHRGTVVTLTLAVLLSGNVSTAMADTGSPVVTPRGAAGTSSAISPEDIARMAKQDKLLPFSAWIESLPDLKKSGYMAEVYNVDAGSMSLLWNGTSPLQDKIIKEGKNRGIEVTIRPWAYSRSPWESATKALWKQIKTDPAWASFEVSDIVGVDLDHPGPAHHHRHRCTSASGECDTFERLRPLQLRRPHVLPDC
jgi:hypothetical protein